MICTSYGQRITAEGKPIHTTWYCDQCGATFNPAESGSSALCAECEEEGQGTEGEAGESLPGRTHGEEEAVWLALAQRIADWEGVYPTPGETAAYLRTPRTGQATPTPEQTTIGHIAQSLRRIETDLRRMADRYCRDPGEMDPEEAWCTGKVKDGSRCLRDAVRDGLCKTH